TALVSMMPDLIARGFAALPFEALRRVPAVFLVLGLVALAPDRRAAAGLAPAAQGEALPFLPSQIDWIRSAGNYVEIRAANLLALRRMTMRRAEALLEGDGFMRIH